MFRKLASISIVIALIAVTGGHWMLLQTVAWTNMLASNLRSERLDLAVTKTFDGKHPCNLCKLVSAGRQSEKKTETVSPLKKFEFTNSQTVFVFSSPTSFDRLIESPAGFPPTSEPPPVPPPRPLQG